MRDEIARQEGRIARHRHDVPDPRHETLRPFEPGEDAGQRPEPVSCPVGNDRKPEALKSLRIAIGINRDDTDLRRSTIDDISQQRLAAERDETFIPAAHATRFASGQHHACN